MPRAWEINDYSGIDGLSLVDVPLEEPGAGEVRLRIQAFSLNWGDMDLMEDNYSFSFSGFPARIGMEAAGIVEAVGEGVEGITIGEHYCTLPYFYDRKGASAETLIIDARYITPAPEGLSAVESASVWMQYMTAYFPLAEISKVGPGQHVLATAATSTAGGAALQIGRLLGAGMIGTTRTAANRDYLLALGADHVIVTDGSGPPVAEQIMTMTGGKGIDAAFDPVGEGMIAQYSPALARNARIYFYGTLDTKPPVLPIVDMFQANATFQPYSLFNYVEDPEMCARGKAFVYAALKDGRIRPRIDRVYPMEAYKEAWAYMRGHRNSHGKIVIETGA